MQSDRPRRVLVVEDDMMVRQLFDEVLRDAGYDVRLVRDGRHAIDTIAEWPPDVVLTDLLMPILDGWALIAAIRALPPPVNATPVVIVSASSAWDDRATAGVAGILRKPFGIDDLTGVIATALAR